MTIQHIAPRQKATYPRCNFVLTARHKNTFDRILAFVTAAWLILIRAQQSSPLPAW